VSGRLEWEYLRLDDAGSHVRFLHQAANLLGHICPKTGCPTAITDLCRNAFDDNQFFLDGVRPVHFPGVESMIAANFTNHGLALSDKVY
jgi:hypothetical protein